MDLIWLLVDSTGFSFRAGSSVFTWGLVENQSLSFPESEEKTVLTFYNIMKLHEVTSAGGAGSFVEHGKHSVSDNHSSVLFPQGDRYKQL